MEARTVLILIGLVGFCLTAAAQEKQQDAWITFCKAENAQPDPIYLDDVLVPLKRNDGREKIALIVYNKSREGLEPNSIYDVLPILDKGVFVPLVMRYNGDGRNLEFRFRNDRLEGALFEEVLRSRAYLVCGDKGWIQYLRPTEKISI